MADHPKIIALERLIIERRLVQAKELMKDIDVDMMRLKQLETAIQNNQSSKGGGKNSI